jgi:hypothetical protein
MKLNKQSSYLSKHLILTDIDMTGLDEQELLSSLNRDIKKKVIQFDDNQFTKFSEEQNPTVKTA